MESDFARYLLAAFIVMAVVGGELFRLWLRRPRHDTALERRVQDLEAVVAEPEFELRQAFRRL